MKFKNRILIITSIVFLATIGFYNVYIINLKNSFIEKNMDSYNKDFIQTYETIQKNIHNTLSKRVRIMVTKKNHAKIKDIFHKKLSYEESFKYLNNHFLKLQSELKHLTTMHLYDKNGISLIRAHIKGKYGDDLKEFRPAIRKLVALPASTYFFETGRAGLFFRIVEPVYENNELLGFFEIGIRPRVFIERIKEFRGLDSFVFINEDTFKTIDKKYVFKGNGDIVFGDYRFFSRCSLDKELVEKIPSSYEMQDDQKFHIDGKTIMAHTTDITDIDGTKMGVFLSFQDFSKIENEYDQFLWISIVLTIFAGIVILFILNKSYQKLTNDLDKYLYILDKINDSIFVIDLKTSHVIFSNEQAQSSLGYTNSELKKLKLEQISIPLNIGEEIICKENLNEIKKSHESFSVRAYSRKKDGSITPVEINFSYVNHKQGEYLVAICHNIEKQLEFEQKDKANEEVINKYVPISQTDLEGNITYVNDAFCKLTKYEKDELIGQNHRILKHPDTKDMMYTNLWKKLLDNRSWNGVLRNITKEEDIIWANVYIEPMFDYIGRKVGYISSREDITDKKELEYMSDHDLLTKAKNRRACEREIHKYIQNAHRYKEKDFGLIMFDIDHFKKINDTYGHHAGDIVLINLSEVIHFIIREGDTFARWGVERSLLLLLHIQIKRV